MFVKIYSVDVLFVKIYSVDILCLLKYITETIRVSEGRILLNPIPLLEYAY